MTIEDGRRLRDRWVLAFIKAVTAIRKSYRAGNGESKRADKGDKEAEGGGERVLDTSAMISKEAGNERAKEVEAKEAAGETATSATASTPAPAPTPATASRRESISDLD